MISALDELGWHRDTCEGGVVWRAPAGDAWIRLRPRCVDVTTIERRIVKLAESVGGSDLEPGSISELVTCEGELATIGVGRIRVAGAEHECVAATVGDVPFVCIDGVGIGVRALATSSITRLGAGLGHRRRRSFRYEGPERWVRVVEQIGRTTWLHPDDPTTRLTVFDARPFRDCEDERLDRFVFLRIDAEIDPVAPDEVETLDVAGLEGRLRIIRGLVGGTPVVRAVAALADDAFAYLAHFETREGDLAPFRKLLASIAPVPRVAEARQLTTIWSDG